MYPNYSSTQHQSMFLPSESFDSVVNPSLFDFLDPGLLDDFFSAAALTLTFSSDESSPPSEELEMRAAFFFLDLLS